MIRAPIILLDLNYTLVSNSATKRSPFIRQISVEAYRADLAKAVAPGHVILITARPAKYRDPTLKSIAQKLGGWQPNAVAFNDTRMRPDAFKGRWCDEHLESVRGAEPRAVIGIESNPRTRAAYDKRGIVSAPYAAFRPYLNDLFNALSDSRENDVLDIARSAAQRC